MKQTKQTIFSLLVVNAVPIFGVVFLHWPGASFLYYYWLESIVIGIYTFLKILQTRNRKVYDKQKGGIVEQEEKTFGRIRKFYAGFFIVHFGIFMLVYFGFITFLATYRLDAKSFFLSFFFLLASHYHMYSLSKEEDTNKSIAELTLKAYKRIAILHPLIMIGGFFFAVSSYTRGMILFFLFVVIKVVGEIKMRQLEKKATQQMNSSYCI